MDHRKPLADREDEKTLAHAEQEVDSWFAISGISIPEQLTNPHIRHHVQTILDLTPTRRS